MPTFPLAWNRPRSGHRQASQSDSSADLAQSYQGQLAAEAARFASVHLTEKNHGDIHIDARLDRPGIRNLKEAPKRSEAAKALAKKVGVEIKEVYLTTGAHDLLLLAEAPLGDHITKFALAVGSLGNVRTSTSRAWPEAEWTKLISELP